MSLLLSNILFYPIWLLGYWFYSIFSAPQISYSRQDRFYRDNPSSNFRILPRNCAVLSHFQLSMWFAHLLGFTNLFGILFLSWKGFRNEFLLVMIPPYSYLFEKIKEPPKGLLHSIFDIIFISGHFLYLFLRYIIIIIWHYSSMATVKKGFVYILQLLQLFGHHLLRLPIYILSAQLHLIISIYKLVLPLYYGSYIPSSSRSTNSIFLPDGITLNPHSNGFDSLMSCAFAARAAATDGIPFDVDSFDIGMDNCASRTMTFCKTDFITPLKSSDISHITGTGGSVKVEGMGDVEYFVTDDDGVNHSLVIKDALYVPAMPFRLMAVNQYAKQIEGKPGSEGTGIFSFGWHSKFKWKKQQFCKTIPHRENIDIPVMIVNNGNKTYSHFHKSFMSLYDCEPNFAASFHSVTSSDPLVPILPDSDRQDYETEPEYTKFVFDLSDNKEIPIILSSPPTQEDTTLFSDTDHLSSSLTCAPAANVPIHKQAKTYENLQSITATFSLQDFANATFSTLTSDQKELLSWHNRLGHLPFSDLQHLASTGAIPKRLQHVDHPKCVSCIFGKSHRRPWRSKGKAKHHIRSEEDIHPGDNTSIDALTSKSPGLIPQMSGFLTSKRYWASTVFVDHATNYGYVYLQEDQTLESTLAAKAAYERHAQTFGVNVRKYHADNGRFADQSFQEEINKHNQSIQFCGVGTHHQNGIAERRIRTLTELSRTYLAHSMHRWPPSITSKCISPILWPFAVKYANEILNNFRFDDQGLSPLMKFAQVKVSKPYLHDLHTFGCPAFVLDGPLQAGQKTPKWKDRAITGIYLGRSPQHAGNVSLILNLRTGHVSPQYHVVFDDDFTTVEAIAQDSEPNNWQFLCKAQLEFNDAHEVENCDLWHFDANDSVDVDIDINEMASPIPLPSDSSSSTPTEASEGDSSAPPSQSSSTSEGVHSNDSSAEHVVNLHEAGHRRSSRLKSNRSKIAAALICILFLPAALAYFATSTPVSFLARHFSHEEYVHMNADNTCNSVNPMAFMAASADNEVYHFGEVLKQPDLPDFLQAMLVEVADHTQRGHWILRRRDSIGDAKPIRTVWSFKRKRAPDGTLLKHKARLCVNGATQVYGVNYWNTYAPVVSWLAVRLMFILCVIEGWYSESIDFTLAFPQADVECEMFVEFPVGVDILGYDRNTYVLELRKNLYGMRQASFQWVKFLTQGMNARGFKSSAIDQCVFLKKDCVVLVYVDDCLIFHKTKEGVSACIDSLAQDFDITREGSIEKYLGVNIHWHSDGTIEMTQPFLIERILSLLGLSDSNSVVTPVVKPLLHRDTSGPLRKHSWSYRTAIGMLGYLAGNTRPDLLMAVHQCARFNNDPRLSHEVAVKRIGRYLQGTSTKGVLFKPDKTKGIECFVDADFAGSWQIEDSQDPISAMSRTGYVICFAGCPVLWVSKLQSVCSLSTTESEYIALSQSLRDVIPMMELLKELTSHMSIQDISPVINCSVFEDNNGALELAQLPRMRPRTRHIVTKYHFFRSYVQSGEVRVRSIHTKEQIADIFTKPLPQPAFEYLRKKLLGW